MTVKKCFKTFTKAWYFILNKRLWNFFCKFCEIFKNTFFTGHPWTTACGCSRMKFDKKFVGYSQVEC